MAYVYKPYEERTADEQYKNLIREIMEKGREIQSPMVDKDGNKTVTKSLLGAATMRFNILENGAPFITERSIKGFWQKPIGEIFGFINGARTHEELVEFGCTWWNQWVTERKCSNRGLETGDLGPGSYGGAFANFPTADGGTYNQFTNIIKQMQERPNLKTHIITPFVPQYIIRNSDHQQKVVVVPCHGMLHFQIIEDTLSMLMWQRSSDVLIGCPSNWVQYSALLIAMAEVLDLVPYEFIHQISDAHIYTDQMPWVDEILSRESIPFPTLKLVNKHKDITKYRGSDFELTDYKPHKSITGIPVAT